MRDATARMRAQGYPYPITYGPERLIRELQIHNGILVTRDRDKSDTFDTARGQQRNPKKRLTRGLASKAFIFAKSSVAGADIPDHEFECEQAIDMLITALDFTLLRNPYQFTGGRYLQDRELEQMSLPEQWAGVVYMLQFTVERGVTDRKYDGSAEAEKAPSTVSNQTQVSLVGGAGSGVACG